MSKGFGLRKKITQRLKNKYQNSYIKMIKLIYTYKQYKNFSGYDKLDKKYKKSIKKYWSKYNIHISLKEFKFYSNKGAVESPKYITKKIYHSKIEPFFNNVMLIEVLENKNYFDLILKGANLPYTVIRKINGVLLNNNYEIITLDKALKIINNLDEELVFKPAIETGGGRGILFLDKDNKQELIKQIISKNDNFLIQKVVKQHKELSKYNSSSINTVRVLSFLYKDQVHILYMVLRVGHEGMRLDNASIGGVQVTIKNDGKFSNYIVDINNCEIKDKNIIKKFKNLRMPFYDEIVSEVKKLHPLISVCRLVGWDITVDEFGKPLIIEINLNDIGMTDKSQVVNGPLFGDMTDEILNEVFKKKGGLN